MGLRPLPLSGGCLCGALRYELRGRPFLVVACHCRDCQKRTSSAFSMNMPMHERDFAFVAGAPREIVRAAPSGSLTTHLYCNDCMSRIASLPQRTPGQIGVRPGTLDDTSWLVPVVHIYVRSALPGAIPPGAAAFDTDPPDWMPFVEVFARNCAEG